MNLEELRNNIDDIDSKLIQLFSERMDICSKIAEYKKQNGLSVLDAARERQKLVDISSSITEDKRSYARVLYSLLFELSRSYQNKILNPYSPLGNKIKSAVENTGKQFPGDAVVACQGVEGAYSQSACEKLFKVPNIMYVNSFEKVFSAIESGLCSYGILPLENSTAGSVNRVYDLMLKYDFNIVRSVRLKIDHNLLMKKGAEIANIKEIISHEQAINQCSEYIRKLGSIKITYCENTAEAAAFVAASGRDDIAAISSRSCAELYGLKCVDVSIQDTGNNYTRFICISKNLEIYPGADKTSIMMTVSNKPGSLYKVLSRFFALSVNLTKLESRPIPDRDFEFMFYFDLDTSVYSNEFIQLVCELENQCENLKYLGSYSEVV